MKAFTITFTTEEASKVLAALRSGAFYAKQFAGTAGDREKVEQITAAVELVGSRRFEGGYESKEEANAAFMEHMMEETRKHGSN